MIDVLILFGYFLALMIALGLLVTIPVVLINMLLIPFITFFVRTIGRTVKQVIKE